jgi:MFS family permease
MGLGAMDKNELARIETAEGSFQDRNSGQDENTFNLEHAATFQTTFDPVAEGKLYQDGQLIVMPAATRDPKDPMNLPLNRRILGVFCLSFFGALAASAEIILGACLPVFALEYAGIDPAQYILKITPFPIGFNPLATLNMFPNAAPIFEVYLLGALPLLMIGVCNLFFIPLAISMGRRPVLLITGLIALGGIVWAGESRSLQSHIAARCVQAVGAGTVESLIPFIIQDMIPVHQRNTWISAAFAAQGVIIIAVGFAAPTIIVHLSWRWVYFVTAIAGAVFLVGVFLFMPETRWPRTRAEMSKFQMRTSLSIPSRHTYIVLTVSPSVSQMVFPVMTPTSNTLHEPGNWTLPSRLARPTGRRAGTLLSTHCASSSTHRSSSSLCSTVP